MKKILVVLLCVLFLMGCSENPLEGSWYDESSSQMITFEGKECSFGGFTYDYRVEDELIIMTVDGEEETYQFHIEDDVLELSFPDIDDFELYFKKVKKSN